MLSQEQVNKLAIQNKVHISKIREAEKYKREHPFDCMQPGDRGYNAVWGEKVKQQRDIRERQKREAEELYREKKIMEARKQGMDKVHRKYLVI